MNKSAPENPDPEVSTSAFWNAIYEEQVSPRWNIGQAASSLAHWLKTAPAKGRVLVPGCGFGHDVKILAEHGFDVVGVDFAPLAIAGAREVLGATPSVELRCADIFDLPATDAASFDYIYEYTCFVAIKPARRPEYVQLALDLLKPGGRLIGCFYNHGREGGPPYDVNREQVLELYAPHFRIHTLEITSHSIERRQGHELWANFERAANVV